MLSDQIEFAKKIAFHKSCLTLAKELYENSEPQKKSLYLGAQRKRRLYGTIVFLSFALESFINEIGIMYCKKYFERVERLTTVNKWLIIPKLISKEIFDPGKEPFQSIDKIFDYRNLFAHYKPEFKEWNAKEYEKIDEINHKLVKKFYNQAIQAMKNVRDNLCEKKDLESFGWLEHTKI